jgi:hypothetical protein
MKGISVVAAGRSNEVSSKKVIILCHFSGSVLAITASGSWSRLARTGGNCFRWSARGTQWRDLLVS